MSVCGVFFIYIYKICCILWIYVVGLCVCFCVCFLISNFQITNNDINFCFYGIRYLFDEDYYFYFFCGGIFYVLLVIKHSFIHLD